MFSCIRPLIRFACESSQLILGARWGTPCIGDQPLCRTHLCQQSFPLTSMNFGIFSFLAICVIFSLHFHSLLASQFLCWHSGRPSQQRVFIYSRKYEYHTSDMYFKYDTLTQRIISNIVKWFPTGTWVESTRIKCEMYPRQCLVEVCFRELTDDYCVQPSKTIALMCPNWGTSSGLPCITEVSPALSRSWMRFSEYCWNLETAKTSLNVAITSPFMLLKEK